MTTTMPEYNHSNGQSNSELRTQNSELPITRGEIDSSFFAPLNIETLANEIYTTPPNGNNTTVETPTTQGKTQPIVTGVTTPPSGADFGDTGLTELAQQLVSQLSIGLGSQPIPDGLTPNNVTPPTNPTTPVTSREVSSIPSSPSRVISEGNAGQSVPQMDPPQPPLERGVLLQPPQPPLERGENVGQSSVAEAPLQQITGSSLSDDALTAIAQQLYAQIPNFNDQSANLPHHPQPTSQGVGTVFPLREGDLQQIVSNLGLGGIPEETATKPEVEQPSFYFLSPPKAEIPQEETPKEETVGLEYSGEPFDVYAVRRDFPILHQTVNGKPLIWLDNAATTQKPQAVIDALSHYYENDNSNVHRGAHTLAARATDAYESAREKVQRFLGAGDVSEIIFARGTTEAVNLVAQTYGRKYIGEGDEIILTTLEHHANIVPWQMLAQEKGAVLKVVPITDSGEVILEEYTRLLNDKTRIVAVSHVSNALGTIVPVKEITTIAHRHGARVLVDGAQAVSHLPVNVQEIGCDFYVFSGHKLFAPTGIGALYAKREILDDIPPWQGGGAMIRHVTFERTIYNDPPEKFEAGTPNIADAVGLGTAIDYINRLGLVNIEHYEQTLTRYGIEALAEIPGLRFIGTAPEKVGVLSFICESIPYEEIGKRLALEGIAVRAGHHCAQPTMQRYGLTGTVRPSLAFYNTKEEIDTLVKVLKEIPFR
jgi:cysteine desulfurase/selenocysteine lyase